MHWRTCTMDDMPDDELDDALRRATARLSEEVPMRPRWREDLIARIESESSARPSARRRLWSVRPALAIAASLLLLAVGAVVGRVSLTGLRPVVVANTQTPATVRF